MELRRLSELGPHRETLEHHDRTGAYHPAGTRGRGGGCRVQPRRPRPRLCWPRPDSAARDVATGRENRTIRGHEEAVDSVAFSPDGRILASTSRLDGTLKLWDAARAKALNPAVAGASSRLWPTVPTGERFRVRLSGRHRQTLGRRHGFGDSGHPTAPRFLPSIQAITW